MSSFGVAFGWIEPAFPLTILDSRLRVDDGVSSAPTVIHAKAGIQEIYQPPPV